MNHLKLVAVVLAAGFASSAMAAVGPSAYNLTNNPTTSTGGPGTNNGQTFNYTDSSAYSQGGTNYGNTNTFTGTAGTVTVSAFGNRGGSSNLGSSIYSAWLGRSDSPTNGFGVTNQNTSSELFGSAYTNGSGNVQPAHSPDNSAADNFPHNMDNQDGYESMLYSFSSAVTLNSISLGYNGEGNTVLDTDFSVLEYTGTGDPSVALGNGSLNWNSLLNNGWVIVGNYCNATVTPNAFTPTNNQLSGTGASSGCTSTTKSGYQSITTAVNSQYWMVGAYLPYSASGAGDGSVDSFKINGFTATPAAVTPPTGGGGTVPEPTSIALFGIAGAALVANRRRRKA